MKKKGVSLMVGYVLLIALAIGLSIGVFFYLKLYLPSEKPNCPGDVAITLDEVKCTLVGSNDAVIDISMTNRGFFTVDTAFIKIGQEDRTFRKTLNEVEDRLASSCNSMNLGLKPDEKYCDRLNYNAGSAINNPLEIIPQEISVEPLIYIDNEPILCQNAIARKKITCTV
jgi:hypothetical protein